VPKLAGVIQVQNAGRLKFSLFENAYQALGIGVVVKTVVGPLLFALHLILKRFSLEMLFNTFVLAFVMAA
jgi:hypothetical protein